MAREGSLERPENARLVVDDEDSPLRRERARGRERDGRSRRRSLGRSPLGLCDAEPDDDGGAPADHALQRDVASEGAHDEPAYREAEAGARSNRLGREEGLEDAFPVLRPDAAARVANENGYARVALSPRRNLNPISGSPPGPPGAPERRSAVRS